MGSRGRVRSNAWIWVFSSTHKTNALSGGLRYRPTISRTFSIKSRVRRQLEGIRPMGLQSEGPPYAVDGAMAQARASGHRARAPVGRIRWSSLKGHAYDSLHVSIGGPAGCTRSRLVQQSIHSPLQEPRPPLPHRRLRHPQLFGHSSVCLSISASEYHPRPLGQRLRRFRSARPRSQCLPFFIGECQRQSRSARAAHVHPPQMSRQKDTRYCNSYATNFRDRTLDTANWLWAEGLLKGRLGATENISFRRAYARPLGGYGAGRTGFGA